jgi:DNA-binding CsgD family transcriptional regulator
VIDDFANPEIADRMFLNPGTIKGYRKDLLLKFGVKNSVALAKAAIEQQLV